LFAALKYDRARPNLITEKGEIDANRHVTRIGAVGRRLMKVGQKVATQPCWKTTQRQVKDTAPKHRQTLTERPVCEGRGDVPNRFPFRRKACPGCGGHVTPTWREQLMQKLKAKPWGTSSVG